MTAAEARQRAAQIVLQSILDAAPLNRMAARQNDADDPTMIAAELRLIEAWLRRRLIGGDKILTRQMERPLGRQVGMSPKQARAHGLSSGTKGGNP